MSVILRCVSLITFLLIIAAGFTSCTSDKKSKTEQEALEPAGNFAEEFISVRMTPEDTTAPVRLAVNACQGLYNRRLGGSVYVQMEQHDDHWLEELDLQQKATLNAEEFLNDCVKEFPGCVKYNYAEQQVLLPNILTAAAALDSVPLDTGMSPACNSPKFDATIEFAERNTPLLATKYVFENFIEETSGLAMLNPGYEIWDPPDPANPALIEDMRPNMVDFVFSEKLFVVYLNNGCIEDHPERALLQEIVDYGQWPTPIAVYGYNRSWGIAGFLHEAQTHCLDSQNMGAISTEVLNLSFFSTRRPPIEGPEELDRNKQEELEYDPNKTYVAFVIGDGDSFIKIMTMQYVWIEQRLADCAKPDNSCAPLNWSMSSHAARITPDVLKWYYGKTSQTGNDFFVLPPSGYLYAYPTSMNEQDQLRFVEATERGAKVLGVHGTVHWDWFTTWQDAEETFLPKYAKPDGVIKGIFAVNVPYMLDAFPSWGENEFYRVLKGADGGETVVFRPRGWRGVNFDSADWTTGLGDDKEFYLSPRLMADELANYPRGTVAYVYMTRDGGLTQENSFMELVKLLPSHVKLVSTDNASKLALQAHGAAGH